MNDLTDHQWWSVYLDTFQQKINFSHKSSRSSDIITNIVRLLSMDGISLCVGCFYKDLGHLDSRVML